MKQVEKSVYHNRDGRKKESLGTMEFPLFDSEKRTKKKDEITSRPREG